MVTITIERKGTPKDDQHRRWFTAKIRGTTIDGRAVMTMLYSPFFMSSRASKKAREDYPISQELAFGLLISSIQHAMLYEKKVQLDLFPPNGGVKGTRKPKTKTAMPAKKAAKKAATKVATKAPAKGAKGAAKKGRC